MQITEMSSSNMGIDNANASLDLLAVKQSDEANDKHDHSPQPETDYGHKHDEAGSPMSSATADTGTDSDSSSVTSYEQDDPSSMAKMFEVYQYPGKGLGLRATSTIPKEAIIWYEDAALTCPSTAANAEYMERTLEASVRTLKQEDQEFILHGLTDVFNHPNAPLTGRMQTNCLPCGRNSNSGAVFKKISLANHSCKPNAEYYWDASAKQGVIFALTEIRPGDEITITYIDMAPTKARQMLLQERFRFKCTCELCSMSKKRRREQDARIKEMAVLELELFGNPCEMRKDPCAAFEKFQRLAVLYARSELEHEKEMDRLWAAIADLCVMALDKEGAVRWLMELTDVELEVARMVVDTWFAEYEDEL